MLTFGSLFAGIGGFDLGFERAGFECKWQVEIDDYATRILEKHWPNVHRERDILQCGRHNLEPVDCIIGGFPCQDISYAGNGAGLDGARSGLFFEAVRLVRELRPRAVVLENVAGLLARGLDRVLGTLAEVGYDAEWHCIPAAAVGAPHIRDRVFVVADAERDGILKKSNEFKNESRFTTSRRTDVTGCCLASGIRGSTYAGWWSVEPNMGRVAHGIPFRVDRLRCLGNAIVPQVAEVVARMAMDRLTGVRMSKPTGERHRTVQND